MGRKPRIDAALGVQLIEAYYRLGSQAEAARSLGISQATASRFLRGLPTALAPLAAEQRQIAAAAAALLLRVQQMFEADLAWLDGERAAIAQEFRNQPFSAALRCEMLLELRAEHARRATEVAKLLVDVQAIRALHQE